MTVVRALEYRPNHLARALRLGSTATVALVIPSITNPFYPAFARGAEDVAQKMGHSVFVCNSDRSAEKERGYLAALLDRGVDGVIFAAPMVSAAEISEIAGAGKAVVAVSVAVPHNRVDEIWIDARSGTVEAARFLADLGHVRIAFIGGPQKLPRARERYLGFEAGLRAAGLRLLSSHVRHGRFDFESGYTAALEMLSQALRPTAIFAANDLMALGGMAAVMDTRLRVPEDVSVMGFDDIPLARHVRPMLTTVAQPSYEVGALATTWLIERKSRPTLAKRTTMLGTTLMRRDSTCPYRDVGGDGGYGSRI